MTNPCVDAEALKAKIEKWLRQAREFLAEPDEQIEIDGLLEALLSAGPKDEQK